MTIAGVLALILSFAAAMFLAGRDPRLRAYYALLLLAHLAAAAAFWVISLSGPADAVAYYRRSAISDDFGIGSQFIIFLLHHLRDWTGASYFDAFLFFQLPGLVGIILLHKAATRLVEEEFGTHVLILALILFLPGLQFWTAAIGKDALAVCAYGMIALGLSRERFDWRLLGAGVLLYFLTRPHVGFVVILAMALAFLPVFGRSRISARYIAGGAFLLVIALVPLVSTFVGLEQQGLSEVEAYVAQRQGYNQHGGSSFDLGAQAAPLRVLTFLYRPLFFDAPGALGVVVSVENLLLLGLSAFLLFHAGILLRLLRLSDVLRFHAFFGIIMTLVLSQTLSNLGLAIRQKMMVVPALFLILVAVIAVLNRRRQERHAALEASLEDPEEALGPAQ
ncbi:MAG: hypothetical protein AAF415_10210 [Pseudomonadota bacterium]